MADRILLDTSYLVALLDEKDIHHKKAAAIHEILARREAAYLYLDCILNETATVLARRAVEKKADPASALRRLRREIPPEVIDWTGAEWPRYWDAVLDGMEQSGGRLSFIDSLLVVIARETGVELLASFDRNFDLVAGLKRISSPADV